VKKDWGKAGYEKVAERVYINKILEKNWPNKRTDHRAELTANGLILHVRVTPERENPDELYSFVASLLDQYLKLPKGSQPVLWLLAGLAHVKGCYQIRDGIRDLFFISHLNIVKKIAWWFVHRHWGGDRSKAPWLIAEGNYGLVRSWRTFNPFKGAFNTHANFWIRKYMFRMRRGEQSAVRVPYGTVVKPDRSLNELIPEADDKKNNAEATLADALTANERLRLEQQAEDSAQERVEDYALEDMRRLAERILSEREHRVFIGRYFTPKVLLRELAAELEVTEGMVRKIGKRALAKIRKGILYEQLEVDGDSIAEWCGRSGECSSE
jgi:RNA polymerase sigma factor (sigma-70 family)